jgi:hypothetical protein
MFTRASLAIVLFATVRLWSQVDTNAAEATTSPADEARMLTPPPVSGAAYPTEVASKTRSNYVRAGLTFNSAYTDNLLDGTAEKPISDISYSIWPTIALDETTPRLHTVLTYSPGFTFYQRTSSYNQANQNVGVDFEYRLSPHVTVSFQDTFQKSSNVFNQPDLLAATPVLGSPQVPTAAVIAPVADRLTNVGNGGISYQFDLNSMIGASGTFTNLHYPDPTQVPGLYDSSSAGGSAFYSHRLSKKHYLGATYQYQRILAYPVGAQNETQTHTVFLFYTVYFKPTISLSLSGGPQHSDVAQSPQPPSQAWSPAGTASLGWQRQHTNFAASYSRIVTGGGGLLGAFHSNSANGSVRQQLTRNWNAGLTTSYAIYKNLDPLFFLSAPGGHTVSGSASLQRRVSEHLNAEVGYTRLHQSYSNIAAVSTFPNVNREWVSISYQFSRPLGR